jgi:glyoxylase-like metal-dependent hydrolase (beta-lactamase superfamily II)
MTEIAPGVHRFEFAIGTKPMAMCLLDGDRVTLIDTGLPDTPESVYLPGLETLGRSPEEVALVVITHADADHIGGNAAVRRLFPNALLACHPLDKRWASDPDVITEERYDGFLEFGLRYDPEVFAVLGSWMGPAEPMDLLLPAGSRIRVGDEEWLEVYHVPGHTPGHILLHNPVHRYALIGDAIFGESQLDTAGGKAAPPPYTDVTAYRNSIETIRRLYVDLLLTCHYPVMRGQEVKHFIDDSLAWSERAEQAVRDLLISTEEPITLGDTIDLLDPVLGPFAAPRELQWALLAHLDHSVQLGEAHRTTIDEIVAWEASER